MHGFNQGEVALDFLCNSASTDIVCVQEHWLGNSQLCKFKTFKSYNFYGVSGMKEEAGILFGRPYGGVGILVKNSLCINVKCVLKTERVVIILFKTIVIINTYLPCDDGSALNKEIVIDTLSSISNVLSSLDYNFIIYGGDFNCDLKSDRPIAMLLQDFLNGLNMKCLDIDRSTKYTFGNITRNCYSVIDFMYFAKFK